jgi:hypothetical protein
MGERKPLVYPAYWKWAMLLVPVWTYWAVGGELRPLLAATAAFGVVVLGLGIYLAARR